MEFITHIGQWLVQNYVELFTIVGLVLGAAEAITRFTPTTKDDAFLERIGSVLRKIMDFLKIPNVKK